MSEAEKPKPDIGTDGEPLVAPPVAHVRPRRFSFVWLVPVLALLGVGWFAWDRATRERGPMITITFPSADGIEPGADLRRRGVTVGVVRTVTLGEDLDSVEVTAELAPSAAGLAVEGTAFWIVRPEVSLSGVSGLETLLGPRYIGVKPSSIDGAPTDAFIGLDGPPLITTSEDRDALVLSLRSPRASGIGVGAPVLYRDIPVGVVRTVALADDASAVEFSAAIDPAYAILVRDNSRFWVASGVGVDWGLFSGLSVRADSLDALIDGAVAFATPTGPGTACRVGTGSCSSPSPTRSGWSGTRRSRCAGTRTGSGRTRPAAHHRVDAEPFGDDAFHRLGGGDFFDDDRVGPERLGAEPVAQVVHAGDDAHVLVHPAPDVAGAHVGVLVGAGEDEGLGRAHAGGIEDLGLREIAVDHASAQGLVRAHGLLVEFDDGGA
jgi:paraquat-inducible protein B